MRRRALILAILSCLCACGSAPSPEELEQQAASCPESSLLPLEPGGGFHVLLNAYYLQEEATRSLRAGATLSPVVEEVFTKATALGVTVVRTWAFNDDVSKTGDTAIQRKRLEYDEVALRGLDLVLARARAHGLKLILPLGGYWNGYGGTRQYVAWAGLESPIEGDPRFFVTAEVVAHYKEHIRNLLQRVNTFDGARYGEHPAVLAWELLNEPRGRGLEPGGTEMRAWVDTMSAWVKGLAPGHRVGTGEEGFDLPSRARDAFWNGAGPQWLFPPGSSYAGNTASPSVDFGDIHFMPEAWGIHPEKVAEAGARWISEHAAVARELGKPLVVGEFGLRNFDGFPLPERRAIYRGWLRCARRVGAAAAGPWMFSYDARPDEWDLHTFYFKDGTQPGDPENRYADLLVEAAANP
jgi:mannan endo-1,4-beta-mannosidase